jgi:hypothetical protein
MSDTYWYCPESETEHGALLWSVNSDIEGEIKYDVVGRVAALVNHGAGMLCAAI